MVPNKKAVTVAIGNAPYGRERAYSALRFILTALLEGLHVNVFLIEDGVFLALKNQNASDFPNYGGLLSQALELGAVVKACGPCCKSRGLTQEYLIAGVALATMHDFVDFVKNDDNAIFF
jgi:tRNA 2-thiouridine synthesizing protein D